MRIPTEKTSLAQTEYKFACWAWACAFVLILLMGSGAEAKAQANSRQLQHLLEVELQPQNQRIRVQDTVTFRTHAGEESIAFFLAPRAESVSVQSNGAPIRHVFQEGELRISLDPLPEEQIHSLKISFEAAFADPIPNAPANFDNPGFGVTGTVTTQGTFLLAGCGWYPQIPGENARFHVKVTAPKGIRAVTAGNLVGHDDVGGNTLSRWEVLQPIEGLALSAGPYVIRSRTVGKTTISTYFFPESDDLSDTYLNAASRHIEFYEKLHGPYPFPKFAVVENFFPTGYGFPSYTLLGSTVLRLPFIPETSLKHEVAHSWWGNGVFVDYDSGNWCEGLTTYVSDYLSKEMSSPAEGKEYRKQILQDYATLVSSGEDLPLNRFMSRESPASRAVGYGKAAFVFHMVRQKIGDEPFWNSLRRIFKERLFLKTSWRDFRDVFTQEGNWDAREARQFFDQWLARKGAPLLQLENVQVEKGNPHWNVRGFLAQKPPLYRLYVPVQLHTEGTNQEKLLPVEAPASPFLFQTAQEPRSVTVDPDLQVFRLLYPEEIPATVNSLKGSRRLTAVMSDDTPDGLKGTFQDLLAGLNQAEAPLLHEKDVDLPKAHAQDLLFLGYPRSETLRALLARHPAGLVLEPSSFSLQESFSSREADSLFLVYKDAEREGRLTALFYSPSRTETESLKKAALKITHYGKYSYLSFSNGMNQQKGTWSASRSPLRFELKESQ
ncbi:M1 family metallopeptidase [Desulforhabdus sp. TSK]|uniref:M1 family metallopeptidase n=1 Tax=Desulforhabdus sp. TSK TaxID=2925014 RepID=UPI001FC85240|nr:M1 family aminopeptidase [Desulforhabdus sp. TSK]GKT07215.1 peptidase M1 [Desulforhabdus sp. TSK]